ncbi:hypothetical protein LHJ74_07035 [Streptomyces sp. N2-109]|uniref:Uncharacterized protein n=1 Tax=Streptomyces gossypii TaxID=2883101 RepID=A0ABT2JP73_9ACTN|nr:hypothetical protein [Streptomyces gossypii]MCT2589677.1 hypothetical protein [Streptomyces gossypii]
MSRAVVVTGLALGAFALSAGGAAAADGGTAVELRLPAPATAEPCAGGGSAAGAQSCTLVNGWQ